MDGLRTITASVQQTVLEAGAAVDPPTVDVDAPRPDELVIALALSAGGRPNARVAKPA